MPPRLRSRLLALVVGLLVPLAFVQGQVPPNKQKQEKEQQKKAKQKKAKQKKQKQKQEKAKGRQREDEADEDEEDQEEQGEQQGERQPKKSRKLDEEQLAARLAKFREDIATKVTPPRLVKKGKMRMDRWLNRFQAIQSEHYIVFTNGPTKTVRRFSKSLEQLHAWMKKRFPFEEAPHLHQAYIFKDETEYYDFCVKVRGWDRVSAERTAGHACAVYYATYYQSPKSEAVMHEATHQLVHVCLKVPGVGSWFQEGMAEYVQKKILGSRPAGGMRPDLRNGDFYHLWDFVQIKGLLADPNGHGSRNYDHSGAIINFMIETKHAKMERRFNLFLKYARHSGYGRDLEDAERLFRKVYGMSVKEVDAAWKAHYRVPGAMTRAEKLIEKKKKRGK